MQKHIERPHLLSPQGLARARTALSNDDAPGVACLHGDTCPNGVGAGEDAAAARSSRHLSHTHAGAEGEADTGRGGRRSFQVQCAILARDSVVVGASRSMVI